MQKKTMWITAATAVLALGGAGIGAAVAGPIDSRDNDTLSGATLERASAAALAEVGAGTVTDAERSDDPSQAYEVEVRLSSGTEVDVELDHSFAVVRVDDGDAAGDDSDMGGDDGDGTASLGSASPASPASAADRERAERAALAAAGGGTVTEFELSDDIGSRYDVEVTLADGQDVDVSLDANFTVVHVDGETHDESEDD